MSMACSCCGVAPGGMRSARMRTSTAAGRERRCTQCWYGGVRVLLGHADARAHAQLDELALEDLPANLVAEVLLGHPAAAHLRQDVVRR